MSALAEASMLVHELSLPIPGGDSTKAAIRRAWRRVHKHFSASRIKDIWYADTRVRVSGDELQLLREAARQRQEEDDARAQLKQVRLLLERIDSRLQAEADARSTLASGASNVSRSVDSALASRGAVR